MQAAQRRRDFAQMKQGNATFFEVSRAHLEVPSEQSAQPSQPPSHDHAL